MLLTIAIIILILYLILLMSIIVAVLLDNHQPAETMAWILAIISLPFVGLVLYYFFGQDVRRGRRFSRKQLDILTHEVMTEYIQQEGNTTIPTPYHKLVHFLKLHNYALPFSNNNIEIYTQGKDFIQHLLEDIEKAEHHVHLEFYIFLDDSVGYTLQQALIKAAKRGVEVRLIYDDVGCWGVKRSFFHQMEKAGIQTVNFMPVRFHRLAHRINYRTHRKLVIIDGKTGYMGGMNIAQRYVEPVQGKWDDMQIKIQGNGVYGMQLMFLEDWCNCTNQLISQPVYYPSVTAQPQKCLLQIIGSAPFTPWPAIMMGYIKLILNAKKYVYIQTPYFMPTQSLIEALQVAAMSGVTIRIMLPAKPGGFWMTWCNRSYFNEMLKAGVEIYLYEQGMLHAKTMVVDDEFCSVGSANIDFRSMLTTFESSAFIYDKNIALQVKEIFNQEKQKCNRIDLARWNKRPKKEKITEAFVRVFSPIF